MLTVSPSKDSKEAWRTPNTLIRKSIQTSSSSPQPHSLTSSLTDLMSNTLLSLNAHPLCSPPTLPSLTPSQSHDQIVQTHLLLSLVCPSTSSLPSPWMCPLKLLRRHPTKLIEGCRSKQSLSSCF